MNRKAIIIYIDKTARCLEEFTWLYKSWIFSDLEDELDIVAFSNPEIADSLPKHDNLKIIPLEPLNKKGDLWHSYGFVNSFAMFNDQSNVDFVKNNYDYILKSDADVFLTPHLKGLTPHKTMIGQGGYMEHGDRDLILSNIKKYAEKFNMNYSEMNHIGASIFGRTEEVIKVVKTHYQLTAHILQTGWPDGSIGNWPGWYKGVASMYAIHLVINHYFGPQTANLYSIDSRCWNSKIEKDVYHIHAWHTNEYWSKMRHFEGKYDKYVTDKVPDTVQEYCHWISTNTLEEIKKLK